MQNILVVGSKGFIGQRITTFLQQKGFAISEADVIVDYRSGEEYFLIDASNVDFHKIFENRKFDVCINCSGAASVPDSISNPMRDYHLNTVNVFKLLDAIKTYQPNCRFINLSSAAVYGNPVIFPVKENALVNPVSPYGYHKAMSEQICEEFHRFFGLSTCSLRIFSAFGEGLYKQLFWDLYQKTEQGGKIKLFGTGEESRDFIYIQDLVQAIYLTVMHASFKGESVNVANGEEVFIKNAVATFYRFFEEQIDYEFSGKGRRGDPNNWVADISTLKSWGYKPAFSLDQGLKNYYDWARKIN